MANFDFSQARLDQMLADANTVEQVDDIEAMFLAGLEAQRLARLADLRNNSIKFLDLIDAMSGHLDRLSASAAFGANPAMQAIRDEIAALHGELHDAEGLKKTFVTSDGLVEVVNDEAAVPGVAAPVPLPPQGAVLDTPEPLNSSSYVVLADEYVRFFNGAGFRTTHAAKIKDFAAKALMHRARYEAVGNPLGIPWWFIAGVHQMESTYNFNTHLHNGDPLSGRTFHVPSGRPLAGTPPFSWEASAADALRMQKLDGMSDWSLPRALWRWERYNGFGYRKRGVASPYLWSFSSIYLRGKYVADGQWDGNATSAQCGAAVLLRALVNNGDVDIGTDLVTETESGVADGPIPADPVHAPNADVAAVVSHPFEAFWQANLADVDHFSWREFLFKGGSHANNGLNTDPPAEFWPNVIPLVRALEALRARLGKPISLTSIYRSPAYNAALGGSATRSQHMAFRAADFQVVGAGAGTPGDWAAAMAQLRNEGVFEGGIGIYPTFVHVDTRGSRADWDNR
jgi:lysozyme family protein